MNAIIEKFSPISLEEMGEIRLINRTDTKFVTSIDKLQDLLVLASSEYRIQEIDGMRNMNYSTVYYDTPDYAFYNAHHDGHAGRQKVRARSYVDSEMSFLEVKTKDNHGKTRKTRIEAMPLGDNQPIVHLTEDPKAKDFLLRNVKINPCELEQKIGNTFHRITLVNRAKTERLTIDTDLMFHNLATGKEFSLPRLAIIELKRDGLQPSPILAILRQLRIHPCGFSKYCIGEALTNTSLRINRMKPRLRRLMKITSGRYS